VTARMDDHLKRTGPSYVLFVAVLIWIAACSAVLALGRKPEEDHDDFPDYNRLEFRKKPLEPAVADSTPTPTNVPPAPPPFIPPTITPTVPDTPPKPPPAAVPIPDGDSEPVLPDDMLKTLTPSSTGQTPSPAAAPAK